MESLLEHSPFESTTVKFDRILEKQRYNAQATKVEVAVGRPDSSNVLWSRVKTTKYSLYSFFFQNLYEQFHALHNIYFLFVCLLQILPATTETKSIPTILFSWTPFLLAQMGIDGWDDYVRHKTDKDTNRKQIARRLRHENNSYEASAHNSTVTKLIVVEEVSWGELRVGDVIQVHDGDSIPADCIVLYCDGKSGATSVETKNLDGETNLKTRRAVACSQKTQANNANPLESWLPARLIYEAPNANTNSFSGTYMQGEYETPLTIDNVLLRGCHMIGPTTIAVIVYTGHMTRLFSGSSTRKVKTTRLEHWLNMHVLTLFVVQLIICSVFAVIECQFKFTDVMHAWYMNYESARTPGFLSATTRFLAAFGRYFLNLSYLVHVSIPFILVFARTGVASRMSRDENLCMKNGDKVRIYDRSVVEDMGTLSHIFTDKTGTLTQNLMIFSAIGLCNKPCVSSKIASQTLSVTDNDDSKTNNLPYCDHTFPVEKMYNTAGHSEDLAHYLLICAVNHGVSYRAVEDGFTMNGPSPDEFSLVCAAEAMGVKFTERTCTSDGDSLSIKLSGRGREIWERYFGAGEEIVKVFVHAVVDFDNVRKRMSVIAEVNGNMMLLTKGADSTMIAVKDFDQDADECELLNTHLDLLSNSGLRTIKSLQIYFRFGAQ